MDQYCRICGDDENFLVPLEPYFKGLLQNMHQIDFNSDTLQICKDKCTGRFRKVHKKQYSRRKNYPPTKIIKVIEWNYEFGCPVEVMDNQLESNNDEIIMEELDTNTGTRYADDGVVAERRYPLRDRTPSEIKLNAKILAPVDEGLTIEPTEGMGRGIFTTQQFPRGSYVGNYRGDLITKLVAEQREAENPTAKNSYMFFFRHNEKVLCYDATAEKKGEFARLINHSYIQPNLIVRKKSIDDTPYIYFTAAKDLPPNTQLFFDYGDRNSEFPWLINS